MAGRTSTAAGFARGELGMGGRTLRWVEAGHGEPRVVLEAGHGGTALAWSSVVPALAAGTRVIAYDRAGLGSSDPDLALPTIDRRLADLAALIEHTGAGSCVLVGHSLGGILAWALTCRRPELVAGLVLVDPGDLDMLASLPGWARWLTRVINDQVLERTRPAGVRREREGIVASIAAIRDMQRTCAPPAVPVVVLSAGRGFPRGVRRHWTALQARLASSAPAGRHVIVADSGHDIPRRRPDVVSELTLQLVGRLRAT